MKFLSVRDLKGKSARVWKDLEGEKEMVITSNGRPIALLSAVNEQNLEEQLQILRRTRAVQALASVQRGSVKKGTDRLTQAEIEREIVAARKEMKNEDRT